MDKNKTFKNFLKACLITIIGLGFLTLGQIVLHQNHQIKTLETRIITLEVRDAVIMNHINDR